MTYFHYYATTSRNITHVFKYGIYPLAEVAGFVLFKGNHEKGSAFAKMISSSCYMALTSKFFQLESDVIDSNSREAVSAEMGIDKKDVKFSDYGQSDNIIISRAYKDILRLQKYRYGTDAMFMMPVGVEWLSKASGVPLIPTSQIRRDPENYNFSQYFTNGTPVWDMSVYASKAGYWAWETFQIDKTSHYEVVKLRENLESVGKDFSFNDLLAVYQRVRTDRGLHELELNAKTEYGVLHPLLQRMVDAYNKRDGKMGMSEIVYLLGLNKINIYADDGKTISQEAIARSNQEIDKVLTIGLDGIREENRQSHAAMAPTVSHKGLSDNIADKAFKFAQTLLGSTQTGKRRPEEFITVRDPGELTSWNYNANR